MTRHAWTGDAVCASFPDAGWIPDKQPNPELLAACGTCPVQRHCARHALAIIDNGPGSPLIGIWGGVYLPRYKTRQHAVQRLRAIAG